MHDEYLMLGINKR